MHAVLRRYTDKLVQAGLVREQNVLIGMCDTDSIMWNRSAPLCQSLESFMAETDRNAVLYAEPDEPFRTIIAFLADTSGGVIKPGDCETRLFLNDLPVLHRVDARKMIAAMQSRPCVVFADGAVVATGQSGPEQAFMMFSSVCFACFVKYFADMLYRVRNKGMDDRGRNILRVVLEQLDAPFTFTGTLRKGPFFERNQIEPAMAEAGSLMVHSRLVDSNFGNISYFADPLLYISRRGGALDELCGQMVGVSRNDFSDPPKTVSTEFAAHREIVLTSAQKAVLHGHPKFSVILSLDCDQDDCKLRDDCHRFCPQKRSIGDIPIVSGEPGAGPYGLCHSVPPALRDHDRVIVHGHGVFSTGRNDFNEAFQRLVSVENTCRQEVFRRLG